MIAVVSGYRRSGTSCMMKALSAGLAHEEWPLLYQEAQEDLNKPKDGYSPNPGNLYEIGRGFYIDAVFLRAMPDKSIVKILYDGLTNLPKGEYVVIWMDRDPKEILDSVTKSDAHLREMGVRENKPSPFTFDVFRPYKREDLDHVKGIMEVREDIQLVTVNFKDLIEDPRREFTRISEYLPIDVVKASEVVRPEYYRSRL